MLEDNKGVGCAASSKAGELHPEPSQCWLSPGFFIPKQDSGRIVVQEKFIEFKPPSETGFIRELTKVGKGKSFNTLSKKKKMSLLRSLVRK